MCTQKPASAYIKLRGYGIAGSNVSLFQVNVNGTLSQMAEAISGVPQSSVKDSILFVIYVNDLPDHLSVDSLLYAHAVKLIVSPPLPHETAMIFSKTP